MEEYLRMPDPCMHQQQDKLRVSLANNGYHYITYTQNLGSKALLCHKYYVPPVFQGEVYYQLSGIE